VFGNLDENGDIIPESIVRIPRIGFSIPFTPPPELGPNILGRDDWNNRFASFEYPGDDGITYITDPCKLLDDEEDPPLGDGTYDTSGRGSFSVIATRIGTSTICNCATNVCTSTDLSADTESSLVSPADSIEVRGLDWVGGSKPCGSGNPNFAIPALIVSRTLPDGTKRNIINTFFGNPFVAGKSVEWSESRSISIRFSDDPDNPVPITDLPKLS
jgi:hypothetical protein